MIELLIALAILGILVAVVIPSYQKQTGGVNRADQCKKPLYEMAIKLEKWKDRRGTYTTNIVADLGYSSTLSPSGTHTYEIRAANAQGTACNIQRCFAIGCVPNVAASDTECGTMILDNFGRKNITGTGSIDACWGK